MIFLYAITGAFCLVVLFALVFFIGAILTASMSNPIHVETFLDHPGYETLIAVLKNGHQMNYASDWSVIVFTTLLGAAGLLGIAVFLILSSLLGYLIIG